MNYANTWTLIFLHVSALSILIVSVLITRHMITTIKRRDGEADRLNLQLLDVNKSPVSSTFGYYTGGQDGWTLASSFSVFF